MDESDYADSDDMDYDYDDSSAEMSEEEEAGDDYGFDPSAEVAATSSAKNPYSVLNREELKELQHESVGKVTSVLGIADDDASRVLRKYKWDVSRVHEEWFSDTDAVRGSVGLVDETPSTSSNSNAEATCYVCYDKFARKDMFAAPCGHPYCKDCYHGYAKNAIESGPTCLDLRCPTPDCKACVPKELITKVCTKTEIGRYDEFATRSFIDDNRKLSWCPGNNCESAIYCRIDRGSDDALDVMCNCGTTFCFNCKEEAHRPVQCKTVRQWVTKNSAESENLNWIMANTKPCPKCHRPIEKNQGCMHMTCSQCRYEFCWLCSAAWAEHGERTGGYYACNRYETAKKKGDYDDETKRRDNAKQSLERYMHYYERWDAHNKARIKAKEDAANINKTLLERLSDQSKTPTSQLRYINDAWGQIIECRRMLKWTYAYGYYAFMEDTPESERQRQFFEFLQGDAESSLERLHDMAEKKLKELVEDQPGATPAQRDDNSYLDFRKKLIGLTDVTKGYFEKLVKQLEVGFDDMEKTFSVGPTVPAPEEASTSGAGPSTSSAAAAPPAAADTKGSKRRVTKRTRGGAGSVNGSTEAELFAAQGFWSCDECTYHNTDLTASNCEVCDRPRSGSTGGR